MAAPRLESNSPQCAQHGVDRALLGTHGRHAPPPALCRAAMLLLKAISAGGVADFGRLPIYDDPGAQIQGWPGAWPSQNDILGDSSESAQNAAEPAAVAVHRLLGGFHQHYPHSHVPNAANWLSDCGPFDDWVVKLCDGTGTHIHTMGHGGGCLLYTSPSPRDLSTSRMPSSA